LSPKLNRPGGRPEAGRAGLNPPEPPSRSPPLRAFSPSIWVGWARNGDRGPKNRRGSPDGRARKFRNGFKTFEQLLRAKKLQTSASTWTTKLGDGRQKSHWAEPKSAQGVFPRQVSLPAREAGVNRIQGGGDVNARGLIALARQGYWAAIQVQRAGQRQCRGP